MIVFIKDKKLKKCFLCIKLILTCLKERNICFSLKKIYYIILRELYSFNKYGYIILKL